MISLKEELTKFHDSEALEVLTGFTLNTVEDAEIAWEIFEDVCGIDIYKELTEEAVDRFSADIAEVMVTVLDNEIGGMNSLLGMNDGFVTDRYIEEHNKNIMKQKEIVKKAYFILNPNGELII